jgi:tetratricopeptide (TPR) repeat protein
VVAKLNLAQLDVVQGRAQAAIPALKKLQQDADAIGLKADSVRAAIYLGQALLAAHQPDAALTVLDSAVGRAEKLGLRTEQARAQYFLGATLAATGKTKDAVPHYREAVRILESISKQDGASRVLDRSDLKDIYHEAAKGYQGGA